MPYHSNVSNGAGTNQIKIMTTAKTIGHGSFVYGATKPTLLHLQTELQRLKSRRHYSIRDNDLEESITSVEKRIDDGDFAK